MKKKTVVAAGEEQRFCAVQQQANKKTVANSPGDNLSVHVATTKKKKACTPKGSVYSSHLRRDVRRMLTVVVNQVVTNGYRLDLKQLWTALNSSKNKDQETDIKIYNELQKSGLVDMYAKCGELQKAEALLDMHNSRLCARRGGPKGSGFFQINAVHGHSSK